VEGYQSEEQQIEAIKQWWRENGRAIVAGVAIGVSVILGWQAWQQYTASRSANASIAYQQMLALGTEPEAGIAQGQRLMEEYAGTGYADLAALFVAKLHLDKGDAESAQVTLRSMMDRAAEPALGSVARLRLAQLELAQGDADEALDLLAGDPPPGFASAYAELRGDAHVAKGDREQAARAYDEALAAAASDGVGRGRLEMKRNDLGVVNPPV
jgi:predicted negative regulator of RcsB-dependent stress response